MDAALLSGLLAGDGIAGSASWQMVLVSGGALIGRVATSRRAMLATSLVSSLLIAATRILLR